MASPVLLLTSCVVSVAVAKLLRWYQSVTTRLSDVSGPPPPSYIIGNIQELAKAPMGTKMNQWTKTYGQTYKLRGALMVWVLLHRPQNPH
jgi:hypothetical protein